MAHCTVPIYGSVQYAVFVFRLFRFLIFDPDRGASSPYLEGAPKKPYTACI